MFNPGPVVQTRSDEAADSESNAETADDDETGSVHSTSSDLSFIDIIESVETTTTGGTDAGDRDRDEFDFVDENSSDDEEL